MPNRKKQRKEKAEAERRREADKAHPLWITQEDLAERPGGTLIFKKTGRPVPKWRIPKPPPLAHEAAQKEAAIRSANALPQTQPQPANQNDARDQPPPELNMMERAHPTPPPAEAPPAAATALRVCAACGSTAGPLRKCEGCKAVRYCNHDCQKKHWPTHKGSCKKREEQLH